MDLGLLTLGDLITDPVTGQRRTHAERHRNFIDQAVLAEQVGFTSFQVGEHHFCDYISSSPPVILAAVAERTTTLRLSTGVTLGVNLDPVRVAEDYATVDVLSGGRLEPCIGRGSYFPHTFTAFGQDPRQSHEIFAEHLELLIELWSHEEIDWKGEFRTPLRGPSTTPRPLQRPYPPIWLGAGGSAASVELAARLGLWLMLPTVFGTPQHFVPMVELYEQKWEEHGHDPAGRRIGCVSHCHVERDSAAAHANWEPRYRAYIEWVNDLQARSSDGRNRGLGGFDYRRLCDTVAICGSPAEVAEQIAAMRELLHVDVHTVMLDMGGLPDDELFPAIELFGGEVIPAL